MKSQKKRGIRLLCTYIVITKAKLNRVYNQTIFCIVEKKSQEIVFFFLFENNMGLSVQTIKNIKSKQ